MDKLMFTCFKFGLLFLTVSVVVALEMSEHVVFKPGGTLALYCWYRDPDPPPDIAFIWHHNGTRLELADMGPNQPDKDQEKFIYNLYIYRASVNDSGTFSCNIHGRPEVVSTTVRAIVVDENPMVAELSEPFSKNILDPTQSPFNIRCYTADTLTDIPNCIYNIRSVKDSDIRDHNTVIVSEKAMQHYGSIESAISYRVTFNSSKSLLGLQIKEEAQNITFTLQGIAYLLSDIKVVCLDKENSEIKVREEPKSELEDQRVFVCYRGGPNAEITLRISINNLVFFDKLITEDTSAANISQSSSIFIIFCCLFASFLNGSLSESFQ